MTKIIKGIGGQAFPNDYNWECSKGHLNRSYETFCYTCQVDKELKERFGDIK